MPAESINESISRRTHDMGLLRVDPDFDIRLMDDSDTGDAVGDGETANDRSVAGDGAPPTGYFINVAAPPASLPASPASTYPVGNPSHASEVAMPGLIYLSSVAGNFGGAVGSELNQHNFALVNKGLFERSQAELHRNFRNLDRDPFFRFQNQARLANLTTHHSNVFMVRFTIGYFNVDPATKAIGSEYLDPRVGYQRPRGMFIVDRSIPVGYVPGEKLNSDNVIIFSDIDQ